MNINENEISKLVKSVILEMTDAGAHPMAVTGGSKKQKGVFDTMEEALAEANKAYTLFRHYNKEQRENIIKKIRELTRAEAEIMAEMAVRETKMGNVYHKILKHHLVADKTPGTEDLECKALSGDRGLTLVEMAPYGIIGAITPSTNPTCTVICNSIGMLAAGNGIVFNPHPNAKECSCYAVDLVNRAVLAAGGPENIVVTVKNPTMDSSNIMVKGNIIIQTEETLKNARPVYVTNTCSKCYVIDNVGEGYSGGVLNNSTNGITRNLE